MAEGGVADDGHGGRFAGQGRAHGHADAGAHLDHGMDGGHGLLGRQGVAADVAEDAGLGGADLGEGLLHGSVGVHMAAAIAEAGGADGQVQAGGGLPVGQLEPEGVLQEARGQLARAGQGPVEAAVDLGGAAEAEALLEHRVVLFKDHDLIHLGQEGLLQGRVHGVGGDLQTGQGGQGRVLQGQLTEIGPTHAGQGHAPAPAPGDQAVEGGGLGLQAGLLGQQVHIAPAGVGGNEHPVLDGGLRGEAQPGGGQGLAADQRRPAMGQAGHDAQHHGHLEGLGQLKGAEGEVVAFLHGARLQAGQPGKFRQAAAVLLVLAAVHAGVIRHQQDEPPPDAGERRVGVGIQGHIQAHMLHGHQRAVAGVAHAHAQVVGDLLIGGPLGRPAVTGPVDEGLDELEAFGGRRARIPERALDAGIEGGATDRLHAQRQGAICHEILQPFPSGKYVQRGQCLGSHGATRAPGCARHHSGPGRS